MHLLSTPGAHCCCWLTANAPRIPYGHIRTNKSKENQQFKAQRTSANDRTDTAWYRMYQYPRPAPFSPQTTAPLHHSCVPIFSSPTDTCHWHPQNTSSLLCLPSCSGAHPVLPACLFVSGETRWLSILGKSPWGSLLHRDAYGHHSQRNTLQFEACSLQSELPGITIGMD